MTNHGLSVKKSLEYIENNLSDKLSLEDLAKKACLSKFHYHRIFHQAVGESVKQFINKKRMESAAKELSETDRPIIEIALKYQYASQEAFSRAFKRTYELTPGKYRRMFTQCRQSNIVQLACRNEAKALAA